MKTKLFLITILVITFSVSLKAQLSWGLRGGVSSSNVSITNSSAGSTEIEYSKGNYGWHAGLIGQIKIIKLFVQPELLFSTAKLDLAYKVTGQSTELGEQKIRKLDLPIMIGVKLAAFKLQAGPVGTWVLTSKSDLLDEKNIEQNFKSFTVGYQAGIGIELSALLLDFKYEGSLSKLSDEIEFGSTKVSTDQRMSQFIFSIGYLF